MNGPLNFVFSKKTTKNDEIFTVDLTLCSSEDFVNFCGLLRKQELYQGNGSQYYLDMYLPVKFNLKIIKGQFLFKRPVHFSYAIIFPRIHWIYWS